MYNYGYRDYVPQTARFTTIDPIRDGNNWFAYCNNEPVNFQDAWGLESDSERLAKYGANGNPSGESQTPRPLTPEEIALHQAAGGGPVDYSQITVENRMPTVAEVRAAAASVGVDMSSYTDEQIQAQIKDPRGMSLPGGAIYIPDAARKTQEGLNALTAHELEHQSRYQNGNTGDEFAKLVEEGQMGPQNPDPTKQEDPYATPGYREYEAQQVEENAKDLYKNGWTPPETTPPCNYK